MFDGTQGIRWDGPFPRTGCALDRKGEYKSGGRPQATAWRRGDALDTISRFASLQEGTDVPGNCP